MLHTQDLIDPAARLLIQEGWRRRIMRAVVVESKDKPTDSQRQPRYVAIGVLNPRRWAAGFKEVHKLVSDKKNGLLVGKTFVAKDMKVVQNRLLLLSLMGWMIPRTLRSLVPTPKGPWWLPWWLRIWVVEVYNFYATDKNGETGRYGMFMELAPSPRRFHPRPALGAEVIWQKLERKPQFEEYLNREVPAKPRGLDALVAIIARLTGGLAGVLAPYLLHVMACCASRRARRKQVVRA
jgi:hypothetical protein